MVLTAVCLVLAVASQAAPLANCLRWFTGEVERYRPYELRLQFNDWYRDAVAVAEAVDTEFPAATAVLVDDGGGPLWFVGLLLQPRRAFVDGPAVRDRLTAAGVSFVVVHLRRVEDHTWWWFEVEDASGGVRRVGQPPPTIRRDGFDEGLDGWFVVGAPEGT